MIKWMVEKVAKTRANYFVESVVESMIRRPSFVIIFTICFSMPSQLVQLQWAICIWFNEAFTEMVTGSILPFDLSRTLMGEQKMHSLKALSLNHLKVIADNLSYTSRNIDLPYD